MGESRRFCYVSYSGSTLAGGASTIFTVHRLFWEVIARPLVPRLLSPGVIHVSRWFLGLIKYGYRKVVFCLLFFLLFFLMPLL